MCLPQDWVLNQWRLSQHKLTGKCFDSTYNFSPLCATGFVFAQFAFRLAHLHNQVWCHVFLVSDTVQIGSNHIFNFPSHPPISVSQSPLPKAYLSCCQTPVICAQVLQGHMKELFKKSLNVICCIISSDSKHIWFSFGSWKGRNWTFSIFCPGSGCRVLDVTLNIL